QRAKHILGVGIIGRGVDDRAAAPKEHADGLLEGLELASTKAVCTWRHNARPRLPDRIVGRGISAIIIPPLSVEFRCVAKDFAGLVNSERKFNAGTFYAKIKVYRAAPQIRWHKSLSGFYRAYLFCNSLVNLVF